MKIEFTKMHGLGNDFVVIDATEQSIRLSAEKLRFLADRHFGVGCDQILLVEPAVQDGVDFTYRIYNADGGEVEQCGNGARCFARYVRDKRLCLKDEIVVETNSGIIRLRVEADNQVTVNMGRPDFTPASLPFLTEAQEEPYPVQLVDDSIKVYAVSMGNPHVVLPVNDIKQAEVGRIGPLIESHACFPQRVNVGFMQIVDRTHIRVRVFERGSGETLACGTGACAAMVTGRQQGWLDDKVMVSLSGGDLIVSWQGEDVLMTGPADSVFEGSINL
jgi:diaminopimelate epimerase